jgi:hypothetical protein
LHALERIYHAPAVNERFNASELRRFRRLARSNLHWAAARNALAEGLLLRFAAYLIAGVCRYPDSLFQRRLTRAVFQGPPFALPRS